MAAGPASMASYRPSLDRSDRMTRRYAAISTHTAATTTARSTTHNATDTAVVMMLKNVTVAPLALVRTRRAPRNRTRLPPARSPESSNWLRPPQRNDLPVRMLSRPEARLRRGRCRHGEAAQCHRRSQRARRKCRRASPTQQHPSCGISGASGTSPHRPGGCSPSTHTTTPMRQHQRAASPKGHPTPSSPSRRCHLHLHTQRTAVAP